MEDIAFLNWFAGFCEGEGWISTRSASTKPNSSGSYYRAEIGIKQKEKSPLDLIKTKFGGTVTDELNNGKFRIWKWSISRRPKVIKIARLILPYMRFRRNEFEGKIRFLEELERKNPFVGYSQKEIDFVRVNWGKPDKEVAAVLRRSASSVQKKRLELGLKKLKKPNPKLLLRNSKGQIIGRLPNTIMKESKFDGVNQ